MIKQCTIKQAATIQGIGLHTGRVVKMTFRPAPENHGFQFQRVDLEDQPIIPADVTRVVSTNRGTTIQAQNAQVHTIEHALSALVGLGIDNVLIEIDGPEVPIMDGSSHPFVVILQAAGLEEQESERLYFEIKEPISYRDEATGSELIAMPADEFSVTAMIDFQSPTLGQQYAKLDSLSDYVQEIASNRTFVFLHELEILINQGLIKGGDLDNAVVIVDKPVTREELDRLATLLNKPGIDVAKEGILNTSALRFQNEPARHKLLDVIGDLSLLGRRIKGRIVATRPGHTVNVEFARLLRKRMLETEHAKSIPHYNPDAKPIYSFADVVKRLPHRYPFLMVDKVIELSDTHVVSVKNITINEPFFQGHFPDNPVFPGVLQIEAMAQTGGLLALQNVGEGEKWDTYFLKIDNCRFKHMVLPGDTLLIKMQLLGPARRGIFQMYGSAYVGSKLVSEAELTAQIVKRS
jgi:UDP-3-O-[3-hydroxymyristoyl] N-acetylglucosamine deacetylase / 3-hydroxyacyl-[acyl-carrier-protein] dehydratase